MIPAVAYARFSSDNQREESIDAQVRAIKYYASKFNYDIIHIYADKAISGRSSERPEFLKMIQESERGIFRAVIVHKLDRFSRNSYDTLYYEKILKLNGVELVSVNEHLDDTPEGALMKMVIYGMNEFYSKNLARETMKGLKENAYACKSTGGIPPLGYDVNPDKTFSINETEARAVRLIFDLYAHGGTYNEIINELNKGGYKTKLGRKFGTNSIHDLLMNEKYVGNYVFNKTVSKNASGKMNRHKYKDDEQIIRVKGGIPAIVTEDIWKEVQKRMKQNVHIAGSHHAKRMYILSGKLFCGLCKGSMVGECHTIKGQEYGYYRCNFSKRTKECKMEMVPQEIIEKAVIDKLNKKIFNPEVIDSICQRIFESYQNNDIEKHIKQMKSEIAELDRKIANGNRAILDGLSAPEFKEVVDNLYAERKKLVLEVYGLESVPDAQDMTLEQIKKQYHIGADFGKLSPTDQKAIIQKLVNRIYVYPSGGNGYRVRVIISDSDEAVDDAMSLSDMNGYGSSPPFVSENTTSFYSNGVVFLDFFVYR